MLRATTIDLWHHHKEKNKQIKAFNNLQSKLASQDTLKATAATAAAISKASEIYNNSQNTNLQTNLRLSSLEKSFRKQELNQNEFQKSLKKTNNTKMPKIKHQLKSNKEKDILDLTTEDKTHLQIPQRRYLLQFNTTHWNGRDQPIILPNKKRKISSMETRRNSTIPTTLPQQLFAKHTTTKRLQSSDLQNIQTSQPKAFYQSIHQPSHNLTPLFPTSNLLQPFLSNNTWHNPPGHNISLRPNPFQHFSQNNFNNNNPFITAGPQQPTQKRKKGKPSWRIIQWRKTHYMKRAEKSFQPQLLVKQWHTELQFLRNYCFVADPKTS